MSFTHDWTHQAGGCKAEVGQSRSAFSAPPTYTSLDPLIYFVAFHIAPSEATHIEQDRYIAQLLVLRIDLSTTASQHPHMRYCLPGISL